MPRLKGKRKQLNGRNPDNEDYDCHWIVLEPRAHDFLRPAHSGLIVVSSRLSALASIVVEPLQKIAVHAARRCLHIPVGGAHALTQGISMPRGAARVWNAVDASLIMFEIEHSSGRPRESFRGPRIWRRPGAGAATNVRRVTVESSRIRVWCWQSE